MTPWIPPHETRVFTLSRSFDVVCLLTMLGVGSWGLVSGPNKGAAVGCFLVAAAFAWRIWLMWPKCARKNQQPGLRRDR
jgi:hypothetical protein